MSPRRFYTLVYICFTVIVVGAFASMAQNDYGLPLLATGCFGLSLIMLLRIGGIQELDQTLFPSLWLIAELSGMALLTLILGFRALFIRFPFVEYLFAGNALLLAGIYMGYFSRTYKKYDKIQILRISTILFYGSLILFLFSFVMIPFNISFGKWIGGASFGLMLIFCAVSLAISPTANYNQDNVRTFAAMTRQINLSPVLMTMLLMMSVYTGLTSVKMIPSLYTGVEPPRYFELIRKAELGEDEREKGEYKYELFEEAYQKFLARRKEKE